VGGSISDNTRTKTGVAVALEDWRCILSLLVGFRGTIFVNVGISGYRAVEFSAQYRLSLH
jgi:hypothetical protein